MMQCIVLLVSFITTVYQQNHQYSNKRHQKTVYGRKGRRVQLQEHGGQFVSALWKCSFLAFGKESHCLQIYLNTDILKAYAKHFSFPTPYPIFYHRHDLSHSPKISLVYSTCFPFTYVLSTVTPTILTICT